MKELPIETAGKATENPWQPLRHPLVRIVQVTALFAAAAMLVMVTVIPTAHSLAFSKDGRKLLGTVNGYGWPMPYGGISVWEASTGKRLAHFDGAGGWWRAIAVSPDGSTIAAANDSPIIDLWDLKRGTKIGTLTGHRGDVLWVGFDPTSGTLASTSVDGEVRLWDVANKRSKIAFRVDEYGAQDVTFTPDGTTLATAHREGIRFWSAADGHLVNEIRGDRIGFLGFSGVGQDCILLKIVGRHGAVGAVLDGAKQTERFKVRPTSRLLALAPDKRMIAASHLSGAASILDAASGRVLAPAQGLTGSANSLAFSRDGKMLAGSDDGGGVCVWDTSTGRLRARFSAVDPLRRWGPLAAAVLVSMTATIFLRYGKNGSGEGDLAFSDD
jgi:WD40 repeat protein